MADAVTSGVGRAGCGARHDVRHPGHLQPPQRQAACGHCSRYALSAAESCLLLFPSASSFSPPSVSMASVPINYGCYTMPCHAMPCHAMPCHAMPCHAMPCHAATKVAATAASILLPLHYFGFVTILGSSPLLSV